YRVLRDDLPVAPLALSNRNYDLFGIIGNVRNGTGFAGVVLGTGWPSIADHRGLPEDYVIIPHNVYCADDSEDSYQRG
ncbi:hypothetical protein, partial [Streptococcus pseudopneumoniae]|uniref:hypothetical protein n=1 Tax=Streptococcus pseudopneumoniae TaxID=257758 RepID=UPI0019D574A2